MSDSKSFAQVNLQMLSALGLALDNLRSVDIKIRPAKPVEVVVTYIQKNMDGMCELIYPMKLVAEPLNDAVDGDGGEPGDAAAVSNTPGVEQSNAA